MTENTKYETSKLCFRPITCDKCHRYIFQCTGTKTKNKPTTPKEEQ